MPIVGTQRMMARLREDIVRFERQAVEEVKAGVRTFTEALFQNTVVWEGDVIRNYQWAAASAGGGGGRRLPVGGRGTGSRAYRREVDPGPTGTMGPPPAGEPRRVPNEAAARADMERVLSGVQRLADFFVSNSSDHADLVDSGSAPTPERSRHPGGVTRLAAQTLRARSRNWK